MTDEPQGMTATAWIYMLGHNRCTTAELAEVAGVSRKQMENLLFSMVNRGYAKRHKTNARKNGTVYSVTPTCKVPQNTFLADILFAVRNPQADQVIQMQAPQEHPRIPRVVYGWMPPVMTPPRAAA